MTTSGHSTRASGALALEDGRVFRGVGFGAQGVVAGEVVFNTAMTGYQEILTDPSYHRQIVTMTVPHVGNTGVNLEDVESARVWVAGFVVRALSPGMSSWRGRATLDDYLRTQNIVGLEGVATRALVRHIRERGAMRAVIAHGPDATDTDALVAMARRAAPMDGANLVDDVTADEPYHWAEGSDAQWYPAQDQTSPGPLVVAYDFGIKRNILRLMTDRGLRVRVVPARTRAEDVLAMQPDGVFLSNGPGDPAALDFAIANTRALLGRTPVFGICLGHQILGLALGGTTQKMRFGHRGGNQPVKNLLSGRVEISSHNHGFTVTPDSNLGGAEVTHINLNDNSVEGLRHERLGAFSVQYHPEAAPGPHDSLYLFDQFVARVAAGAATPTPATPDKDDNAPRAETD